MKKLISAAVLATGLLVSGGVEAAENDGPVTVGDFVRECKDGSPFLGYCYGMLAGISSVMVIVGGVTDTSKSIKAALGICNESGTNNGQRRQVFLNWANNNPKYWQIQGHIGFINALKEAWPCPK